MAMFNNTTSTLNPANIVAFTSISSTFLTTSTFMASLALIIPLVISKYFTMLLSHPKKQLLLPPGPRPLPVIGCLHWLVANKPAFRWIHEMMEKMNTDIACIRLGKVHVITVTSPEVAREFLHKQDSTFASRPVHMSTELPSYGYLTVAFTPSGQQWKKMRKIVTSEVLSVQRHRWLHDKRMEEADHLTRYVYNLCNGGSNGIVNVHFVSQHYCGNVLRKLMLNKRWFGKGAADGGPGPEEIEHVDALFTILAYVNAFSPSDYLPWLRVFDLDGHEKKLRNAIESVKKYNDPIIDERIQKWRNVNGKKGVEETKQQNKEEETQAPEDILDVLIRLTDPLSGTPLLTSSEIKAQILELMFAAVDNPSHAVEWALAEMISKPKILQRAVEEIDQVVGRDRMVQESDLRKLNYVKACVREAFRLHPLYPFNVPHSSNADTTIAGYFIPKNSHVLISRLALGRNPETWEEPLKFKPERHLNLNVDHDGSEVVLTDPKLKLFSFGTGRRGCPAVLLGSTMTTMLLARLLHGFTWTAPQNNVSSGCCSLVESLHDFSRSEPLLALPKPRLPDNVYPLSTKRKH